MSQYNTLSHYSIHVNTKDGTKWYNVHTKHKDVLQEYVSFDNRANRTEEGFISWCTENDIDLVDFKTTREYKLVKINDLIDIENE